MLKLATDANPNIRVITVRHGYESAKTLEIANRFQAELSLNMRIYEAPSLVIPDEDTPEFDTFKRKVKLEPFARAMEAELAEAWLSGVMRHETEERQSFEFSMIREDRIAIYPILDWEQPDAEEFCLAYGLPINDSYYDPTKGLNQNRECGLHLGGLGSSWTSSGL
jgi:phosphoadenosine phosphosulfate reductase